jgi:hypothetical protein
MTDVKYLVVSGILVISGVFFGWWTGKVTISETPLAINGGSVWAADPPAGQIKGEVVPAHQTKTNNNTTCTTTPPTHAGSPESIPAHNPKFCWDTFGNNVSSWSFVLKDKNLNVVPGCSTPGWAAQISTATVTITCQVDLTRGQYYYGFLAQIADNVNYTDTHAYLAQ